MSVVVMCPGCHCPLSSHCYDEHGKTLPMCRGDRCSEHISTHTADLCRDCSIDEQLAKMECKRCGLMRYRSDTPFSDFARALWGERCICP